MTCRSMVFGLLVGCGGAAPPPAAPAKPSPAPAPSAPASAPAPSPGDDPRCTDGRAICSLTGDGHGNLVVTVMPLTPKSELKRQIQQVIHANKASFRRCYDERSQPEAPGTVSMHFAIDDRGAAVNVSASGMSPQIDACVVATLQALTFPTAVHGMQVNYPFTFHER